MVRTKPLRLVAAIVATATCLSLLQGRHHATAQGQPKNPYSLNLPAPELTGGPWINTEDEKPLTLASRKGKVTVVEFWTFG
jgi:hypothetical protein